MKDAYYFSHDSNAKDDPKCTMLIEQLGLEGYGIYWVLIETLRDQPNYKYPIILIPALSRKYNTTAEKMKTVINSYGLFVVDDDDFFSFSLIERMSKFEIKREQSRVAANKRWNKQLCESNADAMPTHSDSNADPMPNKVKESKVNKSKGKEKKESIINTYTSNEVLIKSLNDFIDMRKQLKKPMTDHAIELMLKKLDGMAKNDEIKIAILEQSIMNSWQGIFELKEDNCGGNSRNNKQNSTESEYDFSKFGG